MDLDRNATNHAVRAILEGIVRDLPGYRWERVCTFSDGKDHTVLELSLYRDRGQETAAVVSYRMETGELLGFQYRAYRGERPESLVDLLLDIRNMEYAKIHTEGR